MKTSELIGPALDWAVAKCEGITLSGFKVSKCYRQGADYSFKPNGWYVGGGTEYMPSLHWHDGGPIIEREEICLQKVGFFGEDEEFGPWAASGAGNSGYGPTPLIAAMRCYAASKFGDEIELPEELK